MRETLQRAHISNPLIVFDSVEQARRELGLSLTYEPPLLFIVDLAFPEGESGIDFLRWLRGNDAPLGATPAVILSGSNRPSDREEGYALGSLFFLQKPITEGTLVAALHTLGFVVETSGAGAMRFGILQRA